MNQTRINKEHINLLLSLAESDPKAFFTDLLETYDVGYTANFEEVKSACASKNNTKLRTAIHQINGSSGNLGLFGLSTFCYYIEDQIHKNTFESHDSLPNELQNEYNNTKSELLAYLNSLPI